MTASAQTIHILILTSRPEEAERLVTSLRNGGLAVRGVYTHQPERIEELIEARPCEMILCCVFDPSIDLPAVLARYNELDRDIPLIIVAGGDSEPDVLIQALRAGARDVTERDDMEHLQLVITREIEDLRNRRTLVSLRNRLQQCESRAKEQVESSAEAIALIHEGVHVHANPAYQQLFRFNSMDDLDGYPLLDVVAPEYHHAARRILRSHDQDPGDLTTELEIQCIRADASRFNTRMSLSRADLDGESCLRVVIRAPDVLATDVADEAAEGDAKTGLPDRAAFIATLSQRLTEVRDPSRPLILLYVGIRGFDDLLATEGLTQTLELSDGFASNLQRIIPEQCYLARIGERGFIVMADDLNAESAERLAAEIRDGATLPLASRGIGTHDPDCHIGLLVADTSQSSAAELLDVAFHHYLEDQASAEITERPREAELAKPSTPEPVPASLTTPVADNPDDDGIATQIDLALQADRFKLVYQPIVSLMGDQQENYSVLLRMLDDEQNLHEAKELIGPALRTGRMETLDRWITRHAIEEVTRQRKNGHKVNLFINLSENTYTQESLLIYICDCIQELKARGNWLTFLFQQEHARGHLVELAKLVEGLKKIKCRIALSHFGDIDKPDLLLQSLPVDLVLFNPDLAQGLAEDKNKQKRLQYLTKLTRELNVKSVVTGVEDARTLTVLWTSGIDYVQGNFLQRPSPTLALDT